jgi:hypothetical protein
MRPLASVPKRDIKIFVIARTACNDNAFMPVGKYRKLTLLSRISHNVTELVGNPVMLDVFFLQNLLRTYSTVILLKSL